MTTDTVMTFSLRRDANRSAEQIRELVEKALGCRLQRGTMIGLPALVGEVLGVQVGLIRWRSVGGAYVYQLHGIPHKDALQTGKWREIAIDQAIIDLLKRHGAEGWRVPSPEELKAEGNYDVEDT